jgi:hypothetical protein
MFEIAKSLKLPNILVRELHPGHREKIRLHLLGLSDADRSLRFGLHTSDEVINNYVAHIDFSNDSVFGVFDKQLNLIACAHLAYPAFKQVNKRTAEFGVSVSTEGRAWELVQLYLNAPQHMHETPILKFSMFTAYLEIK